MCVRRLGFVVWYLFVVSLYILLVFVCGVCWFFGLFVWVCVCCVGGLYLCLCLFCVCSVWSVCL